MSEISIQYSIHNNVYHKNNNKTRELGIAHTMMKTQRRDKGTKHNHGHNNHYNEIMNSTCYNNDNEIMNSTYKNNGKSLKKQN